jgi:hypothetical protein
MLEMRGEPDIPADLTWEQARAQATTDLHEMVTADEVAGVVDDGSLPEEILPHLTTRDVLLILETLTVAET